MFKKNFKCCISIGGAPTHARTDNKDRWKENIKKKMEEGEEVG